MTARGPRPWLRSVADSRSEHEVSARDRVAVLVVAAAIVAMAVWFLCFSHWGIGPGSM